MGRKRLPKADDEEIDYDAIPEHLERRNDETELKHYIEAKKQHESSRKKSINRNSKSRKNN
jgi:hypothetical protein